MATQTAIREVEKPARFWNVVTESNASEATITLYGDVISEQPRDWWTGEVIEGNYITPEGFAQDLEQIKDKKTINIKINSLGGDLYTAIAIHNALKQLKGTKNVIIEGIAASAASIIAMAGDVIKIFPGSIVMIHNVAGLLMDYYTIADLKKLIKGFDACERAAAAIYAAKTKLTEDVLRGMMDKETWMTGQEAIDKGFADEFVDGQEPVIMYNKAAHVMVVNGVRHNTQGINVPDELQLQPLAVTASATVSNQPKEKEIIMTLDELKAQHPELVAQIEAEAVAKDRARIQEIEEIQDSIGDPELVASAKFTKPTNAADLALAAMKKQQALGVNFLKNRADEQKPADKVQAAAQQIEDPKDFKAATQEQEKEAIKNTAELYKKVFK